jgi:hypothetical protein
MATKTLILRPTSTIEALETSATPSDTAVENYHMLVNEIECDEAATKVNLTSKTAYVVFGIDNIDLHGYKVVDAKLYVNCGCSAACTFVILSQLYSNSNLIKEYTSSTSIGIKYTVYEKELTEIISSFNQNIDSIHIKCSYTVSNNKAITVYLSQLYFELTIETPDIYVKEQNNWQSYTFSSYYRKKNNIWVPVTKDILKDSYKYILKSKEE